MLKSVKSLPRAIKRFAHVEGPAKAPKVSEVSIWLNVENPKGDIERVQGRVGESLWDVLYYNEVQIGGYCTLFSPEWNLREKPVEPNADEPYCRFCVVEIGEQWYHRIPIHNKEEVANQEYKFLPVDFTRKRLSCCISLEPWMNEMFVRIPFALPNSVREPMGDYFRLT